MADFSVSTSITSIGDDRVNSIKMGLVKENERTIPTNISLKITGTVTYTARSFNSKLPREVYDRGRPIKVYDDASFPACIEFAPDTQKEKIKVCSWKPEVMTANQFDRLTLDGKLVLLDKHTELNPERVAKVRRIRW